MEVDFAKVAGLTMLYDFDGMSLYRGLGQNNHGCLGWQCLRCPIACCCIPLEDPLMFQPAQSICIVTEGYHYQHMLNFVAVFCTCCSWPTIYTAPQSEVLLI